MPYRGPGFAQGQYYHTYNRTLAGAVLFSRAGNYEHCLRLVKLHSTRHNVAVIAYCLMPNHYHFLLRQETDEPLFRFMQALFNAYVQALNQEQGRRGPLFEGRFRHVWVDREDYIVHLCRYIHLNPVKAQLVRRPDDWPYSNYLEWIGRRAGTLVDESFIRERFPDRRAYRQFVADHRGEMQSREAIQAYLWD